MPRYVVPAIGSAAKILAELSQGDGVGATQIELAHATGISKSTMHNLLATLEVEGYVRRSPGTRRYHLGGALIALGAVAAREVQVLGLAIERLPALAERFSLAIYVAQVTPDGEAQIIGSAYPPQPMHVGMRIGTRFGYFDGAIGKCLLASLPPADTDRILASGLIPAHTEQTVTDAGTLMREIAVVRERGWASSIGEYNSNVAVAASMAGAGGAEGILVAVGFPSDLVPNEVPRIGIALHNEACAITAQAGISSHTA